jgi:Lipase (class 3)
MAGNIAFANFVTNQGNNFRVTHAKDMIPKLPGYLLGYAHVSSEYWITAASGNPVTSISVKMSSGAINLSGNGGTVFSSIDDHMYYFNRVAACSSGFDWSGLD